MTNLPEASQPYHIQLYELLVKHFNLEDLRLLCFNLSVNFENVSMLGTLRTIASELILLFGRLGRIIDLINYCAEVRPQINWQNLLSVAGKTPEVFYTISQYQGATYIPNQGLDAVIQLMRVPEVRESVVLFQREFEVTQAKVREVSYFKHLHSGFQDMETAYHAYEAERQKMADAIHWEWLVENEYSIQDEIAVLLETSKQRPEHVLRGSWILPLRQGREFLSRAIAQKNLRDFDFALQHLNRTLNRSLPETNRGLVAAATDLPLANLITALTYIHKQIVSLQKAPPASIHKIADGIISLKALSDKLKDLVGYHNDWQTLDDQLRLLEVDLSEQTFALLLPDLKTTVVQLDDYAKSVLSAQLKDHLVKLEAVFLVSSQYTFHDDFRNYRSRASRAFRRVDTTLLRECRNLEKIGQPLDVLLQIIRW